jgi:hypothetical protein
MTFAFYHLNIGCVLVMLSAHRVCAGIIGTIFLHLSQKKGGYDNNPRSWRLKQTDWRARASTA